MAWGQATAPAVHPRARVAKAGSASQEQVSGPVLDATRLGSPILLDRGWRVGITADPGAALPGFDDSGWAIRDAGQTMADVPDQDADNNPDEKPGAAGADAGQSSSGHVHVQVGLPEDERHRYAWFRMHLRLAPGHGPVALLIELPVARNTTPGAGSTGLATDVFANGQVIHADGPHGDHPARYQEITRLYRLSVPTDQTDLTLALRATYIPFGYSAYTNFFVSRTLRLGSPADLARYIELWENHNLFELLPRLVYSVLLVVLAGFLLALYVAQKGHNEYLWLALHELAMAPVGFVELAGSSGRLDSLWLMALVWQLYLVAAYLFFEFLMSFLALKRRWYTQGLRYTSPILAGVAPALLLVGHDNTLVAVALLIVGAGSLLWMGVWLIFTVVTLLAAALRRNFEAGLLLVPLVLSIVGSIEPAMTAGMSEFTGRPYHEPFTFMTGPIPIRLASIADFTGVLAIVIIIFGRFLRIQREQQHATSELAAARSMQDLMIPQEKLQTPGFELESVYTPANEVGGDFYHVQTVGDRGLLVVIGDVAGKGMKAAMNVSMIMGALRRMTEQSPSAISPARILEELNRVLVGTESFTTCQAAWFGTDGELVLANAGHLPPYLNSQEIAVPGGLPLGFVAETKCEDVRLYLHPGDRVLLLSDGVVEARRPSGELFGFDRVHNLSNQSAFTIADIARSFGQEDDITVLTVRRMPKAQPKPVKAMMEPALEGAAAE
jgi:phosphoserine phosphatase RsbU/P